MKRRLILELKDSFAQHPVYNKIVSSIENKYAFSERPQFGIVVKGASANKVSLAADQFIGTLNSYVMLAYVGAPSFPIEWVVEDAAHLDAYGGRMPLPPGIYYIEILQAPEDAQSVGKFMVDPLLTVNDEPVIRFLSGIETVGQLQQLPLQGTLRLWQNRNYRLVENKHYTVDYATGGLVFLDRFPPGAVITADYRYPVQSIGPVPYQWNHSDFRTLPGAVLAFGKRGKTGDKVAVVVYDDRTPTANAYGGRFDLTFEMDVIARDPHQMEEIADLTMMYLLYQKRPILSAEGIEVVDVSIGGEAEEVADETGDEFFYTASLSLQLQTPWEVHEPLPLTITVVTSESNRAVPGVESRTTIIGDVHNSLVFSTMPAIIGRNHDFERIK
jgi:hypothetical protein